MNAAILIIDDVVDGSDFRKGQPTVHRLYQQALCTSELGQEQQEHSAQTQALQLGVMALLMATMIGSQGRDQFERAAASNLRRGALLVTAGQMLESRLAAVRSLQTESNILTVHAHKTGHYSFEAPMQTGLLLAGADVETRSVFGRIAQSLGLAFQLQDDVAGVFGDPTVTGKPNTDDVRLGLHTMLIHTARKTLPATVVQRVDQLYGRSDSNDDDIEEYRSILTEYGIDKIVTQRAHASINCASDILECEWQAGWNPDLQEYLRSIICFLRLV